MCCTLCRQCSNYWVLTVLQVQEASILFIDQPVGTGYSYVESNDLFTNTTEEIAEDLYICVKTFLAEIPDFQASACT